MTDTTDITGSLQDRQSSGEAGRLAQSLESTGDTIKTYGLAVYGMWVSVGWILGHRSASAEHTGPGHDSPAPAEPDADLESAAVPSVSQPEPSNTGEAERGGELKREPVESGPDATPMGSAPSAAAASPAGTVGQQVPQAVDTYRVSDAGGHSAEAAHGPLAGLAGRPVSGTGPAAAQAPGTAQAGEPFPADIMAYAEIFAAQQFAAVWTGPVALEPGAFGNGNVTVVAGDYYDIQISLDFGSFVVPASFAGGAEISFGSALYSPASAYDLVVVDQDLVEINAILQHNIGALGAPASGLDVQANQALIAGYGEGGGVQVTLGEIVNVAAVQQINYLAGVSSAVQLNDAAILDGAADAAASYGASFSEAGIGHDYSALYVTGSYYEINLVLQVSALAAPDGGNAQVNSAAIYDFEGVAMHQFVGGDEIDLNTISQANYLSQVDQMLPVELADIFPNVGQGLFAGVDHDAPAADGAAAQTTLAPPPLLLPGIGAQSDDGLSDLVAL